MSDGRFRRGRGAWDADAVIGDACRGTAFREMPFLATGLAYGRLLAIVLLVRVGEAPFAVA